MKALAATSPQRAALLALGLVVLGFIVGYGYGYGINHATPVKTNGPPAAGPWPPVTEGMRVTRDDRLLAFTGIYAQSQRSSRFVLDLKTGGLSAVESPGGWQDYVTQWSSDGRTLLYEREKIPRPVEAATPGLYQERITPGAGAGGTGPDDRAAMPRRSAPEPLTPDSLAPPGEKATAGFWAPDGRLVVKMRGEPKALYEVQDGQAHLVDRAAITYYQNRAVRENGRDVYYVVRDMPGRPQDAALYRVQDGQARQLSAALTGLAWAYVAENARWMVVCRQAANGSDWAWTLYTVGPQGVRFVKQNTIPADVVTVYWSPDFKQILGASGQSLWLIAIPTLQVHQLGTRTDWKADDAIWLNREPALVIAASGRLWKVRLPSGEANQIWKFPDRYWQ